MERSHYKKRPICGWEELVALWKPREKYVIYLGLVDFRVYWLLFLFFFFCWCVCGGGGGVGWGGRCLGGGGGFLAVQKNSTHEGRRDGGEEELADRTDGGGAKTRQVTLTQGLGVGGPVHTSWDRLGGFRWCSGTYR